MSIEKKEFGAVAEGTVYSYCMENANGMRAEILNYGGIIKNLWIKDRNGVLTDVVLGWDNMEGYADNDGYLGAAIGRNSNRIAGGKFTLNGTEYQLAKNNNGICNLHGGDIGFNARIWNVECCGTDAEPMLKMTLTSPDGEEGFPGTLQVTMTYTLTAQNGLRICYEGISDADTIFNMTNHSYFNLKGCNAGTMYDQVLQMNCSFYTPNTEDCYPNGEVLSVMGTPFDFRAPKPIGQDIAADFEQIELFEGYDHNFIIDGCGFRKAAILSCEENGIVMETYTDLPGVQIYTANAIDEERKGKGGEYHQKHQAVCLETQYFPNAFAYTHFESPILKKGEKKAYTTEYRFSVK